MSRATQHRGGGERSHLPPDQLVEDLDKFLYLIDPAGGLGLKEKGDMGPSASRYRPPTKRMAKRAPAYLRDSKVDPAWMSLFATAP